MSDLIEIGEKEFVLLEEKTNSTIEIVGDETVVVSDESLSFVSEQIQGPPGKGAVPSSDPNNIITSGEDGGLFAPDALPTDPVAYYILARS